MTLSYLCLSLVNKDIYGKNNALLLKTVKKKKTELNWIHFQHEYKSLQSSRTLFKWSVSCQCFCLCFWISKLRFIFCKKSSALLRIIEKLSEKFFITSILSCRMINIHKMIFQYKEFTVEKSKHLCYHLPFWPEAPQSTPACIATVSSFCLRSLSRKNGGRSQTGQEFLWCKYLDSCWC